MGSNSNKQRVPFYCSWIVIVIAAVILWPLAVLLVWKRGQYDRKLGLNLGLVSMVFGVILIILAIAISYIAGDTMVWAKFMSKLNPVFAPMAYIFGESYVTYCAFYGIIGVVFARMGYEGYKKSKVYTKYVDLIENHGVCMVSMLADEIGTPEVDVIKTLEKMFKKGFLPDYELTHNNKKVVKKPRRV